MKLLVLLCLSLALSVQAADKPTVAKPAPISTPVPPVAAVPAIPQFSPEELQALGAILNDAGLSTAQKILDKDKEILELRQQNQLLSYQLFLKDQEVKHPGFMVSMETGKPVFVSKTPPPAPAPQGK